MVNRTRSARHQKEEGSFSFGMKEVVPLAGAAMMVAPMVVSVSAQTVHADEVGVNQASALINQIGATASQIAAQNDLYASVMIAQAILESGNGTSQLSSAPNYNLFGVKAYHGGPTVWLPTKEYLNGRWQTMTEPFKKYDSYYQSLLDHASLLINQNRATGTPRYAGAWKSNAGHYTQATAHLTGRYATDPAYAQKLNTIIQRYNLTRFDIGGVATKTATTPTAAVTATSTTTSTTTTSRSGNVYTVVQGDTLWAIAKKFGIPLDQLTAQNNISSELIVVGQQLSI